MAKLTKKQALKHENALRILSHESLSPDEILEVFENYREEANHINSMAGAFFTPYGLARDLAIHIPVGYQEHYRVIDLCAGIGILGYAVSMQFNSHKQSSVDITCVEINPDYVKVGKMLLPQAKWICGDALDPELLGSLGYFDYAISNPPFGHVKTEYGKSYISSQFEYMTIEAAARIADEGLFIIPQMSAPFVYSGTQKARHLDSGRGRDFEKRTGIELGFNIGVDTAYYRNEWHGTAPVCEIVCCDFRERANQIDIESFVRQGA